MFTVIINHTHMKDLLSKQCQIKATTREKAENSQLAFLFPIHITKLDATQVHVCVERS